jgi:selenocysteine-specific elongation factor
MPIDRVFTVKGHGVVVTGTLAQGRVSVGDEALVMPEGHKVRIRSIHSHDESVESSEKGRRTALNLSGVKAEQMYRGQQIGRPDAVFASTMVDARVHWLQEPKHAMRVRVSIGAEEAIGKLFLNDHDAELVQIRLDQSVACSLEQPLIIRRYSPPDLLGGGRVVVPQAKKRRRNEQLVTVSATVDDGAAILHVLQDRIEGLPTEEICRRLGRTPQALGTTFEQMMAAKKLYGFAGQWFDPASLELAFDRFNSALLAIHNAKPSQSHWPRESVVQKAGLHWTGKPLDRLLQHWAAEGRIYLNGTQVRSAEFVVKLNEKQESLLSRVEAVLEPAGMNVPSVEDVSKKVFVPIQAAEEILRLGIETGRICRVADGLFYPVGTLDKIKSELAAKIGKSPFSAADVRDMFQSSRRYVIPLLEFFDSQGWTIRQGDVRRIA